jgi:hypothetical protein
MHIPPIVGEANCLIIDLLWGAVIGEPDTTSVFIPAPLRHRLRNLGALKQRVCKEFKIAEIAFSNGNVTFTRSDWWKGRRITPPQPKGWDLRHSFETKRLKKVA